MNLDIQTTESNLGNVEDKIQLRKIVNKYLFHWPVFLVAFILTISLAYLYLRYSKPVYQINSTLLIKDEDKGMAENDILSQLSLFGGSKVVENEQEIIKSRTLMSAVVKRLSLDVNLSSVGRLISSVIYEKKPVDVRSTRINSIFFNRQFRLTFPQEDTYLLEDLKLGTKVIGKLNEPQRNEIGAYTIRKTGYFHLNHGRELILSFLDPIQVTNDCLSNLVVTVTSKQSTVLQITYSSPIPKQGEDVLNELVKVYNEESLVDKNRTTQSTIQFIDERLGLITGELTDVEKNVEGFKSSQGLTDISSEATLYLESVKANDAQLNEVNLKLGVIKEIRDYVDSETPQEKLPSTFGIEDPVVLSQINQLSELQLKKISLTATTQPSNPIFAPINEQIASTRAGIKANLQNIESALLNTRRGLIKFNASYESSIKKIPGQERQFISIKRQQTIKESLYLYLLQKKEEAALSYASAVADSRIIDTAFASTNPVKPRKSVTYLVAILFGFILPVFYIHGKDLINNRVTERSSLTENTNVPILGEISFNEDSLAIVVSEKSRTVIAEQFRAIRTNLQFLGAKQTNDRDANVTLFTSSMSGEGKSFVASNLATALAISGKKTVLIELDLRRPKISKYLNLNNSLGISNYLIRDVTIDQILFPSGVHENLTVISSGPIPPNPSELLIRKEFDMLIENLKGVYDEIVIDSPPVGLVTDAQILARVADVTIYIVRHGVTYKDQIREIDNLYRSGKFPNLTLILNGILLGGHYGYSYGYGYGYYSNDSTSRSFSLKDVMKNLLKRF